MIELNSISSSDDRKTISRPDALQRRAGFTLIEILIVMGIILVLMSILIVAAKQVSNTGRMHSTKTTLETARTLYSNYQNSTHLAHQPQFIYQGGMQNACVAQSLTVNSTTDFWHSPESALGGNKDAQGNANKAGLITVDWLQTQIQSGVVSVDAVENTATFMGMARTVLVNNNLLKNLPPSTVTTTIPTFIGSPMLIDGWGNPIIYVPSGGLANVTVSGAGAGLVTSTGFHPYSTSSNYTFNSLDQPFFVSAGASGDLSNGDTNIYSFNNN